MSIGTKVITETERNLIMDQTQINITITCYVTDSNIYDLELPQKIIDLIKSNKNLHDQIKVSLIKNRLTYKE